MPWGFQMKSAKLKCRGLLNLQVYPGDWGISPGLDCLQTGCILDPCTYLRVFTSRWNFAVAITSIQPSEKWQVIQNVTQGYRPKPHSSSTSLSVINRMNFFMVSHKITLSDSRTDLKISFSIKAMKNMNDFRRTRDEDTVQRIRNLNDQKSYKNLSNITSKQWNVH